jgi:thiamine transport system substrate-binding protein
VVLGLDSSQMPDATIFMQPHGQAASDLTLPEAWTDVSFLPFDYGHLALIYDADKLKTPPLSFKELIENAAGPKLIIEDPRTSAPGFGFLLWMKTVFGDQTAAAWGKLAPRVVTFSKGWSEAYELFLKGEADMVVSYTTSPAYHIAVENKTNYKAAIFPEGHYLQIEVMGVTRSARDPDLAKRFVAFMLSDAAHEARGLPCLVQGIGAARQIPRDAARTGGPGSAGDHRRMARGRSAIARRR